MVHWAFTTIIPLYILTAISRWTWVSWYQNVSILNFTGVKDDGGGADNWSYKTCKVLVKSSPTNQHGTFYWPDALPVAQTTVSKHWKELHMHKSIATVTAVWPFPSTTWTRSQQNNQHLPTLSALSFFQDTPSEPEHEVIWHTGFLRQKT